MDPLTHEELMTHEKVIEDAKEVGLISFVIKVDFYAKLIAAARSSIPRPISEAPRDGTWIVGRDLFGCWHVCSFKATYGPTKKVMNAYWIYSFRSRKAVRRDVS